MLSDYGLERTSLADGGCVLRPQAVQAVLAFGFLATFGIERLTGSRNLSGQAGDALRHGFKLERKLPAFSAEAFYLRGRTGHFGP